jgi:hypothetical protein
MTIVLYINSESFEPSHHFQLLLCEPFPLARYHNELFSMNRFKSDNKIAFSTIRPSHILRISSLLLLFHVQEIC